ncbi:MAG: tyrosine-type recombinase/integrase [Gammaproteobacteria bacterium]
MATSDFSKKLPRLIEKKGRYLYWQDSERGPDGKRKTIALGRLDDPRSLARYYEIEAEYAGPQNKLDWLFTRFAGAFLGDEPGNQGARRVKEFAPKTRREYRKQLNPLRAAFGAMGIRSLRKEQVQLYLESHPSPIAANRQVALLSRIYTWAERLGLADSNPCLRKLVARNEEGPRDRYIHDEEYLARQAVAPEWMAAVMDLAYLTALRLGDLLAIRLAPPVEAEERACWLDAHALYVQPQKTKKTTGRRLSFAIEGELLEVIRHLLDLRAARPVRGMYLICNRRGQPYTVDGFESLWQRLKAKDGNRSFQFRDIRAKSATDAADQGFNAQILLGHGSPKTTEIYLRSKRAQKALGPPKRPQKAEVIRFPGANQQD